MTKIAFARTSNSSIVWPGCPLALLFDFIHANVCLAALAPIPETAISAEDWPVVYCTPVIEKRLNMTSV